MTSKAATEGLTPMFAALRLLVSTVSPGRRLNSSMSVTYRLDISRADRC
jgi:hypothetical protein